MVRNDSEKLREKYETIFPTDKIKAQAFDKIAENYYLGNFGTMQKSDIDVLLFSIYLEGILNQSEDNIDSYSDYTLAKQLGITQSRVGTLKVKKQLQYPYEDFDWKQSFKRVCKYARYESGKFRINLRDKNLYYEIRNQIEQSGGYTETTLTTNLLVISPTDFYGLVEQLMSKTETDELKKAIKKAYASDLNLCEQLEKKSIGKAMSEKFGDKMIDVLVGVIVDMVPVPNSIGIGLLKAICTAVIE